MKKGESILKFKLRTSSRRQDVQIIDEKIEEKVFSLFKKTENVVENQIIPKRKITRFSWNGSILDIAGYIYIEGLPLQNEDNVRKKILLVNNGDLFQSISLKDCPVEAILNEEKDSIPNSYKWAGFHQQINFAKINDDKPLPQGEFKVYIELEVMNGSNVKYREIHTVGNIKGFLKNDVYATKMEFHSAKKMMKFNLIVTYDEEEKTVNLSSNKLQEIDPSLLELNTGKNANRLTRKINRTIFKLLYVLFCLFPINKRKITFASDSRTDLSGNFEFVYEELLNREQTFEFKFFLKESIRDKKSLTELVSMAYHFATSKNIIIDDFYPMIYPLKIRKNADLVQLWHAVGAFKTFGYSRIGLPGGPSPTSKNHRNYTKVVVSSDSIRKHYAEGFGVQMDNVVATGIPRTDFFFDEEKKKAVKSRLYEEYPYLKNKKVILFAPTFRGNGQQSAHYPFDVLNFDQLYRELKDEYIFLFKIHPFVKNTINIPYQYSEFFYDFSDFREINELLLITDLLITDYSSVCFEFALLNKPMIFFSYDVDDYIRKRDFYYDYFSFIPGPLAKTCHELVSIIKNNEYDFDRIDSFVNYFFDDLDGKSSKRVVDELLSDSTKEESV
ncbi:CDP-glycerol glycerophosphotransferase family protein [Bacillus altitudinis]|uniref:CDP-glycerol glycerophosphotransferase family protein n=1 Tax=Bacillus altitudinis TaxID=293387 RepID=UPI001C3EDFF3|nr:CDP-glycerol glycerophosphotransferase family protein [Bacillus altitudinis]QXJ49166.1 CDP-glycerol glycerophosphotransferase family protein [Bacillus altitudinis]